MADSDLQNKLAAARTRLILDKPFLGALVLRLPLVAADPNWCKGAATDAKKLYYNQDYINALTIQQTQFVLAKQALHCALSHFARRQHRIKHRWDLACDYAVNPLLINDGLKAPPETLVDDGYEGMTAEEIYHYIDDLDNEDSELDKESQEPPDDQENNDPNQDGSDQQPKDSEANQDPQTEPSSDADTDDDIDDDDGSNETGGLAPQPSALSPQEQEELSVQWQQRLAGAAQQAMQAGKLGGSMARMVDFMLQPKLPWRMLLARYMTASARDDYSYSRPSSRRGDPAIFPSMRSAQINIAVGIDISGSVDEKELNEFMSEVDAIKANMRAKITLLPCDAVLAKGAPFVFEPWDEIKLPNELKGGGGTDFCPVFDWLELQDQQPDLLVYFTDCQGSFPELEPTFPVIWLVKGKDNAPWGQRVQLN
ncbi:MAG: VWA-like domain-containing protein [Gammaproteobacteria bacterium]